MSSRAFVRSLCATTLGLSFGSAALAQSSELYTFQFDGSAGAYKVLQNGSVQRTWLGAGNGSPNREYGLAVADDLRSVDYFGSVSGAQYSLDGTPTGVAYNHGVGIALIDGTTDGVSSNWAGNYFGTEVYRWDRNWANPTLAFNVANGPVSGITYDTVRSSLWIYAGNGGVVTEYSLDGQVLSSFDVSTNSADNLLAYEPSTQTIWVKPRDGSNYLQYSRAGDLLQTVTIAGTGNATLGLEFSITGIPTPGALSMLGLGGLALGRRRR